MGVLLSILGLCAYLFTLYMIAAGAAGFIIVGIPGLMIFAISQGGIRPEEIGTSRYLSWLNPFEVSPLRWSIYAVLCWYLLMLLFVGITIMLDQEGIGPGSAAGVVFLLLIASGLVYSMLFLIRIPETYERRLAENPEKGMPRVQIFGWIFIVGYLLCSFLFLIS